MAPRTPIRNAKKKTVPDPPASVEGNDLSISSSSRRSSNRIKISTNHVFSNKKVSKQSPQPIIKRLTSKTTKEEDSLDESNLEKKGSTRGRPRKVQEKLMTPTTRPSKLDTTVGQNEEPNICTRCENQQAGKEHFYRLHNGMLAAEEQSFMPPEKRQRWRDTMAKKFKLRCQVASCRKVINSITAMTYHEKTCGIQVEKILCTECNTQISSACYRQHQRQHERDKEDTVRWNALMAEEGSKKKKQVIASNDQEMKMEGRQKRSSALVALKKLKTIDKGKDEMDDYEDDEEKYEPSATDDDSDESELQCVDSEIDGAIDIEDDSRQMSSRRQRKASLKGGFRPTVQFPRMQSLWKRSLDVLGYAQCEMSGCDEMKTSLEDIVKHYLVCRRRRATRATASEVIYCNVTTGGDKRCRFRCPKLDNLVNHFVNKHKLNLSDARARANAKKDDQKQRKGYRPDWKPNQQEYDALYLFD